MQSHENALFTPTEAAVLTRLSVKAVNNAIDRKTVPTVAGNRAGYMTRLLDLRALMSLALERRLMDSLLPDARREVFDAVAAGPEPGVPGRRVPHNRTPARVRVSRAGNWRPRGVPSAVLATRWCAIPTSWGAIPCSRPPRASARHHGATRTRPN
jgi:hypothetical protein